MSDDTPKPDPTHRALITLLRRARDAGRTGITPPRESELTAALDTAVRNDYLRQQGQRYVLRENGKQWLELATEGEKSTMVRIRSGAKLLIRRFRDSLAADSGEKIDLDVALDRLMAVVSYDAVLRVEEFAAAFPAVPPDEALKTIVETLRADSYERLLPHVEATGKVPHDALNAVLDAIEPATLEMLAEASSRYGMSAGAFLTHIVKQNYATWLNVAAAGKRA